MRWRTAYLLTTAYVGLQLGCIAALMVALRA